MNHNFQPSLTDITKCSVCKYTVIDHTDRATCECCSNSGKMEVFAGMLMCSECIAKEKAVMAEHQSPENQQARLDAANKFYTERSEGIKIVNEAIRVNESGLLNINNLMDKARAVDYAVQVRTDIFNAETIATYDVFKSIDEDGNIPAAEKAFSKAKFLSERQSHFQKVIFDANQQILETQNKLRVVQSELNKIVNALRAEEREKLKIASPEYKPGAIKSPKESAGKPRKSKPKFDKKELMDEAAKLQAEGIPIEWHMLQMMCTSRDMTPKQAAEDCRKRMKH